MLRINEAKKKELVETIKCSHCLSTCIMPINYGLPQIQCFSCFEALKKANHLTVRGNTRLDEYDAQLVEQYKHDYLTQSLIALVYILLGREEGGFSFTVDMSSRWGAFNENAEFKLLTAQLPLYYMEILTTIRSNKENIQICLESITKLCRSPLATGTFLQMPILLCTGETVNITEIETVVNFHRFNVIAAQLLKLMLDIFQDNKMILNFSTPKLLSGDQLQKKIETYIELVQKTSADNQIYESRMSNMILKFNYPVPPEYSALAHELQEHISSINGHLTLNLAKLRPSKLEEIHRVGKYVKHSLAITTWGGLILGLMIYFKAVEYGMIAPDSKEGVKLGALWATLFVGLAGVLIFFAMSMAVDFIHTKIAPRYLQLSTKHAAQSLLSIGSPDNKQLILAFIREYEVNPRKGKAD